MQAVDTRLFSPPTQPGYEANELHTTKTTWEQAAWVRAYIYKLHKIWNQSELWAGVLLLVQFIILTELWTFIGVTRSYSSRLLLYAFGTTDTYTWYRWVRSQVRWLAIKVSTPPLNCSEGYWNITTKVGRTQLKLYQSVKCHFHLRRRYWKQRHVGLIVGLVMHDCISWIPL